MDNSPENHLPMKPVTEYPQGYSAPFYKRSEGEVAHRIAVEGHFVRYFTDLSLREGEVISAVVEGFIEDMVWFGGHQFERYKRIPTDKQDEIRDLIVGMHPTIAKNRVLFLSGNQFGRNTELEKILSKS